MRCSIHPIILLTASVLLTLVSNVRSQEFKVAHNSRDSIARPAVTPQQKGHTVQGSIYRDRSTYPLDYRKPCHECDRPARRHPATCIDVPGLTGRPYKEKELGGCTCGKNCRHSSRSMVNLNWPRPFSAKLEEFGFNRARPQPAAGSCAKGGHCKDCQNGRRATCDTHLEQECPECVYAQVQSKRWHSSVKPRPRDVFDRLYDTKIGRFKRTDNGYCGPGSDPYGCVGESKVRSNVAGIGFRQPGIPVKHNHPTTHVVRDERGEQSQVQVLSSNKRTAKARLNSNQSGFGYPLQR